MSSTADEFTSKVMRHVACLMCHNIGWDSANIGAIDVLGDLMKRQFLQLAKSTHRYAEHYGRTEPNLDDAALALKDANISVNELEEFVQNFDPVTLPYKVPQFPVKRQETSAKLNFLRPGSEEVLTRPVHVHEYMPPMIFDSKREEEVPMDTTPGPSTSPQRQLDVTKTADVEPDAANRSPEEAAKAEAPPTEPSTSGIVPKLKFKEMLEERGVKSLDEAKQKDSSEDEIDALEKSPTTFVPFSKLGKAKRDEVRENPAIKRVRMMLEEDGHPMREITSVMMTSSGYLSSSREGRLPDSRPPANREFFDPSPPPVEKKKKAITMKRIVEGVKKIDKENGSDVEMEEPQLFSNPDIIPSVITIPTDKAERKKLKKKHKLDKETIRKLAKGLERADKEKNKLKIFQKSQTKFLLDKSKKIKDKRKANLAPPPDFLFLQNQQLETIESEEEFGPEEDEAERERVEAKFAEMSAKMMRIPKKKNFLLSDPNRKLISPAKLAIPSSSSSQKFSNAELMKKKRGRPRKAGNFMREQQFPFMPPQQHSLPPPSPGGQGLPLSAQALANLGRGLMDERHKRPLKIKRSHMQAEPELRSLFPEVQLNLNVPATKTVKPPRMQPAGGQGFDMGLMGLPSAPGLIPSSNFVLPPPPPLIKMPVQSPNAPQMPPSIQITPATPSTPSPTKGGPPFGVCSSLTITPIELPGQKQLPTRYDKTHTPGIGAPAMQQRQSKQKDKSPSAPEGLTITPIVMNQDDGEEEEAIGVYPHISEEDDDDDLNPPLNKSSNSSGQVSILARLDEELKSKEARKKEKERRKELKKERKKDKKDKSKDKDKSEKHKDKKEKKKKHLLAAATEPSLASSSSTSLSVPKLTLKLSGHSSGTPTPVDSPNPPPIYVGEPLISPPLKKITIKPPVDMMGRKSPSPEIARFSPLVTRPPLTKAPRAAKVHAAAAVAAEALGASLSDQAYAYLPPMGGEKKKRKNKSGDKGLPAKASKSVGLVTQTVGSMLDEYGNKIWICPTCGRQDDGSPMIGCDKCDDWYHFPCQGITEEPSEDSQWYCPRCRTKKKRDKK